MSQRRRSFAALCTLLYLLVVGVVPVLHAASEGPEGPPVAHMHAADFKACAPAHDALHCPACQVAVQKVAASGTADAFPATLARHAPVAGGARAVRSTTRALLPDSRAPPRV